MIETIKKHWKSIVLTVLVIITLVGICLSIYQGGYCVTSKFAGNIEAKLNSVSLNDTTVSYEKYMSMYSGVTSVVGNYITGIAAFLTLLLLAAQFYDIQTSKKRYEKDKLREEICGLFELVKRRIDSLRIKLKDEENARVGEDAVEFFAENIPSMVFHQRGNIRGDDWRLYSQQVKILEGVLYAFLAINKLARRSVAYSNDTKIYLEDMFDLVVGPVYEDLLMGFWKLNKQNERKIVVIMENERAFRELMRLQEIVLHLYEWKLKTCIQNPMMGVPIIAAISDGETITLELKELRRYYNNIRSFGEQKT